MGVKCCVLERMHTLNEGSRGVMEESGTECQDICLVQPLISYVIWGVPLLSALSFFSDTQLCLTLCDPMDCRPPGSSVYGILQVKILEWVAISFSKFFQ